MEKELQYVNYHLPENMGQVQAIVYNESLWLTEKAMADLFQIDKSGIGRHLKHIYESGELQQDMTVAKFATVVNRGVRGEVLEDITFYNLDAIIAVGYRVNSLRATRFRQWATKILSEYMKKGFARAIEQ